MARFIFAAIVFLIPYQAAAQDCTPYRAVAGALSRDFGEVMQAQGLSGRGWAVEVWTNPTTGSWSIVLRGANGCAQIADGGQGFTLLPVKRGTES